MTTEEREQDLPAEPDVAELAEDWVEDEPVVDDPVVDEAATDEVAVEPAADEALDELEAEELEMLTEDETSEAIVVDEAQEMRDIRRAEIALEGEAADGASEDEFVCSSCFLVLKVSQLADKRKKICKDCAA